MPLSFEAPKLAMGGAPLGSMHVQFGFPVGDDEALSTVRHCLTCGIRFFDTAPLYGNGRSEIRFGEALAGVPRDSVIIATKVGWLPNRLDGGVSDGLRDYSRDSVLRSIDQSLARLKTSYLDIVHVHDPDEGADYSRQALDEAFPALNDLKRQGVIRAVGSGMNQWRMLALFARNADVDCFLLAGRYSLLEQEPLADFFPLVEQKQIAIFLGGVFNSGILATGAVAGARFQYAAASEAILERTRRIEAVCARYQTPLRAAALQFAAAPPAVKSLVLGMVTPAQVDDNRNLLALPIPANLWAELKYEGLIDAASPTPWPGRR